MRLAAAAMLSGFLGGWTCPLSAAEVLLDWKGNDTGIVIDGPIYTDNLRNELSGRLGHNGDPGAQGRAPGLRPEQPGRFGRGRARHRQLGPGYGETRDGLERIGLRLGMLPPARRRAGQGGSQDALIGIHSATSVGVGEDTGALAATATMARQAAAYGVPDALIGKLVRMPASSLARLSAAEIRSIPGAVVAQSVSYSGFVAHAVPVGMAITGYSAGAYIAAGLSSKKACDFPSPQFQAGCVRGLHDSPPRGWAGAFVRSRGASRP